MPTNRSFFSQFIGSLIGFRPRSPSSGTPIKASAFSTSSPRRRSTSSLNSAGSGGAGGATGTAAGKDRETGFGGEKWWIGGRRADGSERYYPIAPLRYSRLSEGVIDDVDATVRLIEYHYSLFDWILDAELGGHI